MLLFGGMSFASMILTCRFATNTETSISQTVKKVQKALYDCVTLVQAKDVRMSSYEKAPLLSFNTKNEKNYLQPPKN